MAEAGKYGIVYADPPWRYDMKRGNGVAENHYPTMSHTSQPGVCCLAKSSTLGWSPMSLTILSRTSSGFLLCCSIWEITNWWIGKFV